MLGRARGSDRRSPPVAQRFVCPACFRSRDDRNERTCCGYAGGPVDRQAGDLANAEVAVGRIPAWRWWGGDIAPVAMCTGAALYGLQHDELAPLWWTVIGACVLIGRWRCLLLRRQQRREVRIGPTGIEWIGFRGEHTHLRWSDVQECRAAPNAYALCVRAGGTSVSLEGRMPGYDAAMRAVLARSPVLAPTSIWHSPMSHRTASWLLAAVAALAAVGLIAVLVCVGNQR